MTLVLRYSARSDRGLVRSNNQDSVYAGPRLLALADGMGGHAAGEVASSLVIDALKPLDADTPGEDLLSDLRDAAVEGNAAITQHVADAPDLEGMGTTLTAILFAGSRLGLVHVGDSRAYQLRDGVLSQITKDDTFVQSLIDEGRITEEEAHTHPHRSLLMRAITGQEIEPSLTIREARVGDRYLLCSDGLSGVVTDETLAHTLRSVANPAECADRMIELALKGGGPDNITCIVADVVDVEFGDDDPIVGGAAGDGFEEPQPNSAAARAAAHTVPHRIGDARAPTPTGVVAARVRARSQPRGRAGSWLAVLAVTALLAGTAALAWVWIKSQYYVAGHDGQVVIYRGVEGDVPLIGSLSELTQPPTGIALADLPESLQGQITEGIRTPGGLSAARDYVEKLRGLRLPCRPAQPAQPQLAPNVQPPPNAVEPATESSRAPCRQVS